MADEKPRRRSLFGGFTKLIKNMNPVFPNDTPEADADLAPPEKDKLFAYQLTLKDPRRLGKEAFFHAGVANNSESMSAKIHDALCAASILSTHEQDSRIYTARITRKLPNQVPWISVHNQRRLVGLLFFWEEELVRWQLIDTQAEAESASFEVEKAAALKGREGEGDEDREEAETELLQGIWEQHRLAMATLEANRRQLPSKRDQAGNRVGMSPGMTGMPPAYGDVLSTVGVIGARNEASPRWGGAIASMGTPGFGHGRRQEGNGEGSSSPPGEAGALGEPALDMPSEKGGASR